ncbi:MAG: SGNH/GDSL hydrolase family protein [Armatimonadota bacterium]
MSTRDYRSEPFKRMVVLGESTVQGGPWLAGDELKWADIVAKLIDSCQEEPVEYFNEGIGASVISPRSAEYADSNKPSALERYHERVIAAKPDLFIMAYGLNDMRTATDVTLFAEEMETIIRDVKAASNPVVVLTDVYYMTGFDRYPPFDKGSIEIAIRYNMAIEDLAKRSDCLFADIWSAMNKADWLVHGDGVHSNAVGNILIANRVFEAIAGNCSCLSRKTEKLHKDSEWTRIAASMAYSTIEPLDNK